VPNWRGVAEADWLCVFVVCFVFFGGLRRGVVCVVGVCRWGEVVFLVARLVGVVCTAGGPRVGGWGGLIRIVFGS